MNHQKLYTELLEKKQSGRWKSILKILNPYRWNLRRLRPGFALEVGCGIGRNLVYLDGNAVGVDTNPYSIKICHAKNLRAFLPEDFLVSEYAKKSTFDSLLLSHVLEHMEFKRAVECIKIYLPFLKSGGRIILITPQEVGYRSDSTHLEFVDFEKMQMVLDEIGFFSIRKFSFPFPRWVGRFYIYNEFVSVGVVKNQD